MYDHEFIGKDQLIGEVILPLKEFGDGEYHEGWFQMQREPEKKKKDPSVKGEIHLKVWFTGPNHQPDQKKAGVKHEVKPEEPQVRKGPVRIEDGYEMGKVLGR